MSVYFISVQLQHDVCTGRNTYLLMGHDSALYRPHSHVILAYTAAEHNIQHIMIVHYSGNDCTAAARIINIHAV